MRIVVTLLIQIAVLLLLTSSVFSQAPESISYQAVVRDGSNALVQSSVVGMQISILQGSASGAAVYIENHSPPTNSNGLVSVEIGAGAIVSGTFSSIDWANGPYFIKTETDPAGGINYTISGTSQLLSVPYALHANTASSISGGITETDPVYTSSMAANITPGDITNLDNLSGVNTGDQDGSETKVTAGTNVSVTGTGTTTSPYVINTIGEETTNNFYLGQDTLGGIVLYIYLDQNGEQHGILVSKTEGSAQWQTSSSLVGADRTEDGVYNTGLMTSSPAANYVTGLGTGWYLPSVDELHKLWINRYDVQKALRAGGHTLISRTSDYWSSTEYSASTAIAFGFDVGSGYANGFGKTNTCRVRAIKAF